MRTQTSRPKRKRFLKFEMPFFRNPLYNRNVRLFLLIPFLFATQKLSKKSITKKINQAISCWLSKIGVSSNLYTNISPTCTVVGRVMVWRKAGENILSHKKSTPSHKGHMINVHEYWWCCYYDEENNKMGSGGNGGWFIWPKPREADTEVWCWDPSTALPPGLCAWFVWRRDHKASCPAFSVGKNM